MEKDNQPTVKTKSNLNANLLLGLFFLLSSIAIFYYGYTLVNKPTLAVLLFHEVVPNPEKPWELTQENLEAIVEKFIEHKYKFIDPRDFENLITNGYEGRNVMISFDDGITKELNAIKSLYQKYNIKSALFLLEDKIDKDEYMSTSDILDLKENYGTFFGLHGKHHKHCTEQLADGVQLGKITEEARVKLNKDFGLNITWFSYPFGSYNQEVIKELKEKTNLKVAFTIEFGKINVGDDRMKIKRYMYMGGLNKNRIDPTINYSLLPPDQQKNGLFLIALSLCLLLFALNRLFLTAKQVKIDKQDDL